MAATVVSPGAEDEQAIRAGEEEAPGPSESDETAARAKRSLEAKTAETRLSFTGQWQISPSSTLTDLQTHEAQHHRLRAGVPIPPPDHVGRIAIDCLSSQPSFCLDLPDDDLINESASLAAAPPCA